MKAINIRDLQKQLKAVVDAAQTERVVITRHGKPAAVLVGVEGMDWEAIVLQSNPEFWQLIRQRRQEPTISLDEMRQRVLGPAKPAKRRRRASDEPGTIVG